MTDATDMRIRDAAPADLTEITRILNRAVRETTAVWYDAPRSKDQMEAWFETRTRRGFPVLVAEDETGVVGYASYGPFRPHDGFKTTVEHSIYVTPGAQGRGIGSRLLEALVARAVAQGLHVMVGGLEAGNAASLALHARHGFVETGRMPEIGAKFGRRLTLVFMQRLLRAE